MSLNAKHFRNLIVRPTIKKLGLWTESAEELLMLTWAQETLGQYLKQGWKTLDDARGVGLGPYSMEPTTHDDHWRTFLLGPRWHRLGEDIKQHFCIKKTLLIPPAEEMVGNLYYATAMTRVHYFRVKEPLPPADRIDLLAIYWDENYNRNPHAGFPSEAVAHYKEIVSGN